MQVTLTKLRFNQHFKEHAMSKHARWDSICSKLCVTEFHKVAKA